MTIKQFQDKLAKKAQNIKTFAVPLKLAAFSTTAIMGERIFDEGKKTDESQIINHKASLGSGDLYSEKPIYVSKLAVPSPKGAPTGKPSGKTKVKRITGLFTTEDAQGNEITKRETIGKKTVAVGGKSKFKNGNLHKSKYFATGYKGYRENVGRQTGFIDLSLTGELRMDFGNEKQTAEPRKISDTEYQIRLDKEIDQKKREGLEEKYGTIFTLSETEKELFYKTMQFEFNKQLGIAGTK